MDKKIVLTGLREIAKEKVTLSIDDEAFKNAVISEAMQVDSLGLVRLIVVVENRFKVELPDDALINVSTFDELANVICRAPALTQNA